MTDLQVFRNEQFGEVRTVVEGDKVLFCGSDVAKALGYARPNNDLVHGLWHSQIKNPVGYCYKHKAAMTAKQMRLKKCLQKQCNAFKRYEEHPLWEQRERTKELRRQKKRA